MENGKKCHLRGGAEWVRRIMENASILFIFLSYCQLQADQAPKKEIRDNPRKKQSEKKDGVV